MLAAIIIGTALQAGNAAAAEAWACTNQVEIWCGGGACTARPPEETTPLSVHAGGAGAFSVCAYSGCWEGAGEVHRHKGRFLLTAENAPFSSGSGAPGTDITLLIFPDEGAGFVRAGGLATPLTCKPARQTP